MGGCWSSATARAARGADASSSGYGPGPYPCNYLPSFPTELVGSYSTHGKRSDKPKQNQDTGLVVDNLCGNPNQCLFMVCDGHGSHGHQVSQLVSKEIITDFVNNPAMKDMNAFADNPTKGGVVQAFTDACEKSQKTLKEKLRQQANDSGTTFVCAAINGNNVWTGCVGDSRAVIGAEKDRKILALDLSADQNCENPSEKARIIKAGGQIADFGGFERVVAPDQNTVLAPTRSIGDCEFDSVGVVPTPEVTHYHLTGKEHVLIVASDGLWEFVSSADAVKIAMAKQDATEAAEELLVKSQQMWAQDGSYCDDITILVAFLPLKEGQKGGHGMAKAMNINADTHADSGEVKLDIQDPDEPTALKKAKSQRRVSMSSLGKGAEGQAIGGDKSEVSEEARNVDLRKADGLNPNALTRVPGWAWAPEWDRVLWPKK